jgi:DNA-binding transcriptional MerR regulator/methylmalonyl-CoA mutase cobalamin-binding subunit
MSWVNIAVAERETGVGKDTLRVWERRYGFPRPERNENGDRLYPHNQIARLRLLKSLLDRGHRPGKIVSASDADLKMLDERELPVEVVKTESSYTSNSSGELAELAHRSGVAWRTYLLQQLAQVGLERFLTETLPRLNSLVGEAWSRGELQIYEEHLYTEQVQNLLRQTISTLPAGNQQPLTLLTTVPGEPHLLGVLMVEAMLALRGIRTLSLGAQTPLKDIAEAARVHSVQAVALSFSAAYPARRLQPVLSELRQMLDDTVRVWVGGAGTNRLAKDLRGIERVSELRELLTKA